MGQSVIHPENTGEVAATACSTRPGRRSPTPGYNESQKLEILAFSYGFLTHAAGDMWAHTLVNDFAGGVFPGVSARSPATPLTAAIAVKHLIVEGYIGDATPGYDGNDEHGPAPGHQRGRRPRRQ